MWKSAYVVIYQLLNWKMHGETLQLETLGICSEIYVCCHWVTVFERQ